MARGPIVDTTNGSVAPQLTIDPSVAISELQNLEAWAAKKSAHFWSRCEGDGMSAFHP